MSSLPMLPDELLISILVALDINDILNCRQVSPPVVLYRSHF